MTQNTSITTSSTSNQAINRVLNAVTARQSYKDETIRVLRRHKNTGYVKNNPVKATLAALVISGEEGIEPVVSRDTLREFSVTTEELRDAELAVRDLENNTITSQTPRVAIDEPQQSDDDDDGSRDKIEYVHSQIEELGAKIHPSVATMNKAHSIAITTQPRNHNPELIAGAALYFASHYTGEEYYTMSDIEREMLGSSGNLGRISAHLAGFDYWNRKCIDDSRGHSSKPVLEFIEEWCDELNLGGAVESFAIDLLTEFEVLDKRWHLPENVGIPAIYTAVTCITGNNGDALLNELPERPTKPSIDRRMDAYLSELGELKAYREASKYVVEEKIIDTEMKQDAKTVIESELTDERVRECTGVEIADIAVSAVGGE